MKDIMKSIRQKLGLRSPLKSAERSYYYRALFSKKFKYCLIFLALGFCSLLPLEAKEEKTIVAVTQIVDHPSLDAVRKSMIEQLASEGYVEGENLRIIYESAQGAVPISVQIAKRFVSLQPDVIVPISTPSAQSVISANMQAEIPVVFAAVTDPVAAKLVKSLKKPGGFVTGASDAQPVDMQMKMIREMLPELKKIGVIYNPGEVNSTEVVNFLRSYRSDLKLIESTASSTSDVSSAVQRLIGKVDAIYIPLDNTVVSALGTVLKLTFKSKVPVFSSDPDLVQRGVLASLGIGYEEVGEITGELVAKVLQGKNPGDLPVGSPKKPELHINMKSAEKLGLEVPPSIRRKAKHTY